MFETFLKEIGDTKIGKAILAERGAAAHRARQEKLDALIDLEARYVSVRAEHDRALPPLQKAERDAAARYEAAREKLRAAQRARSAATADLQSRATMLRNELIRTADPRITDALRALNARVERERHAMTRSEMVKTDEAWASGKRLVVTIENERARNRVYAAIRTARAALEALQLANPDDLESAIAAVLAPVDVAWSQIGELDPMPVSA
jgi:hypothetical protein